MCLKYIFDFCLFIYFSLFAYFCLFICFVYLLIYLCIYILLYFFVCLFILNLFACLLIFFYLFPFFAYLFEMVFFVYCLLIVGEPKSQKLNKMGWTWHGLPYFLFVFFLLTLTLRTNNLRVCSAGNIAKKNCGHFSVCTLYFLLEKCEKLFFPQILSGFGRLSINAFQVHRTHVLTTSTEKITLKTHFYMILH